MDDQEDKTNNNDELTKLLEEKTRLETELEATRKDANEKAQASQVAQARAEAEASTFKTVLEATRSGNAGQVTEEQWKALEEKTGVSRDAYIANAQISQQQIEVAKKDFDQKLKVAEERAIKAQERLEKLASERTVDKVMEDFYSKKPVLQKHKTEVNEYLGLFSELDRSNPDRLKTLLNNAEVYVKGKVGEKMKLNSGSSPKLGGGNDEEEDVDHGDNDFVGLQTDAQKRTVAGLKLKLSTDSKEKTEKLLDRFQSADKNGVSFSAETEWAEAQQK